MVLNKSKWDRKAKFQYMKKHGILPAKKEEETVRPKWSSKSSSRNDSSKIILEDSEEEDDDEWDETDDALLKHFYPQLGEELNDSQKAKLKQQILEELELQKNEELAKDNDAEEQEPGADVEEGVEEDGIYLGTKPKEVALTLEEMISASSGSVSSSRKPRKLLSNKISDNFLEEYGLEDYSKLVKNDDYSAYSAKQKSRNVNDIPADELDGFLIGESVLDAPKTYALPVLTEEERTANEARLAKVEQQRLFDQIRTKFAPANKVKNNVLEINNITDTNYLNNKIVDSGKVEITDEELNEDLNALGIDLGPQENSNKVPEDTIEDLLSVSATSARTAKENKRVPLSIPESDKSFLDDLLG